MIIFSNEGELDIRALTTFGLSVKKSESAIGRFGTGLKYALAVILRNGGSVTINSGANKYTFETRSELFRDEEKQFVFINSGGELNPLGFTTDLGRDWEDWQAFREIYSNSKDEPGSGIQHTEGNESVACREGMTYIAVDHRPFDAIFFSLEQYFISDTEKPLWENDDVSIYAGRSNFVFYQGIRVHELKHTAAFRYNIKRFLDLTEDRTAKYGWQIELRITQALPVCESDEVCNEIMDSRHEFERELPYTEDFTGEPSKAFAAAVIRNAHRAPLAACQLVRMTLPEDSGTLNVAGPAARGSKQLSKAVAIAQRAGLDKTGVTFVLGVGLPVVGDYTIRKDNVILNESILDDQEKMTFAVAHALATYRGKSDPVGFLLNNIVLKPIIEQEEKGARS